MYSLIGVLSLIAHLVRAFVAVVVVLLAIVCLLDWLVRTRRINAFSPVARFLRTTVSPMLDPVERSIVRAGGLPSAAPLWTLAIAIVAGIVLISAIDFLILQIEGAVLLVTGGVGGIVTLLIRWIFAILQIALIVRVIVSWLPISPYSAWVRWSFTLTEPILRPLRQIVPTLGPFDITPIVAYFLLDILEWAILSFHFL
jgi:YggT family protein